MPPKKSVANGDVGDAGGVSLSSSTFLDHELIITLALQMGRSQRREGTSTGSIRNRISALRVKQRDLYLELSWELPEGGAGHSAKKASKNSTPKTGTPKRKADGGFDDGSGEGGGDEVKTPSKKPRGRKPKAEVKEKSVEKDGEEDVEVEEDYVPMSKRVKEEPVEEMV
ncbi:hypothetical protein IG631_11327 [Alternaria alternata]|nr:hypothetical protein IG631_11327 [Alternaria alternata]